MESGVATYDQAQCTTDMAMEAFLGALDDILQKTNPETDSTIDDAIAARVLGLFDTASEFYSPDDVRSLQLMQNMAARLGAMACCDHTAFSEILGAVGARFGVGHEEPCHDHDHSHDKDHPKSNKKSSHKSKKGYGWGQSQRKELSLADLILAFMKKKKA